MFVATKRVLYRDKSMLVAKHILSRPNFLRDKHNFVETSILLSRQRRLIKHVFVATKMILVAAPANDILHGVHVL